MEKNRADSVNFFTSLFTLVFSFIAVQGVPVPPDAANDIIDGIVNQTNLISLMVTLVPNFLVPVIKVITKIKKDGVDWSFRSSPNFISQVSTAFILLLGILGVFDLNTAMSLAAGIQGGNMGYHFLNK